MAELEVYADTSTEFTLTIQKKVSGVWTGFKPDTLKLDLFDVEAHAAGSAALIVNARDVLADCTAGGVLTVKLPKADLSMKDSTKESERRGLRVFWTYNSGVDRGVTLKFFSILKEDIPTT